MTMSYTTSMMPPPGPRRRSLGRYPRYSDCTPSSRAMSATDCQLQRYGDASPGRTFRIRETTTSKGVLSVVPTAPPAAPARNEYIISCDLDSPLGSTDWRIQNVTPKYDPFHSACRHNAVSRPWKNASKPSERYILANASQVFAYTDVRFFACIRTLTTSAGEIAVTSVIPVNLRTAIVESYTQRGLPTHAPQRDVVHRVALLSPITTLLKNPKLANLTARLGASTRIGEAMPRYKRPKPSVATMSRSVPTIDGALPLPESNWNRVLTTSCERPIASTTVPAPTTHQRVHDQELRDSCGPSCQEVLPERWRAPLCHELPSGRSHGHRVALPAPMSSQLLDALSGWVAGAAGVLVGHPIDTVRVRVMSLDKQSPRTVMRELWKQQRSLGFFRGIVPPLVTNGISE
jgi:hypothetical protein